MDAYSQLKPAWHPELVADLRAGRWPTPAHVQLILSDLCNQDCSFCAYRMSSGLSRELFGTSETHNPNRKIPTEKAREIIEDCARVGVKAIQFTGGGEPTVHPAHNELFALAQKLGLDTALVTNGVKLNPQHDAVLAMKWIRVSVDAGTQSTYSAVRRVAAGHWTKVWQNIESLAKHYEGTLGVGFVVTQQNYKEIGAAAELCKRAGVSNMRVGAVFSAEGLGYYGDILPAVSASIAEAKAQHDSAAFEVVDLFSRRAGDLSHGRPTDSFCGYQHFTTYIGADLGVYRCCNTAYTAAGKVGSLTEQSFAQYLRQQQAAFDARSCRFCQFLGQNAAIGALVREPQHVNFV